nr:hypothetical protein [Tanacetum cinerariifolium]
MVTKHDKKIAAEEGGKKKAASKADKSKKPTGIYWTSTQPLDDISEKMIQDTSSLGDSTNVPKKGVESEGTNSGSGTEVLKIDEERDEEVSHTLALEEKTAELDEGQARSDPGNIPESRPPPDVDKMDEDQAGSDPKKVMWLLLDQILIPCTK